jgi:hypothetical protein
MDKKKAMGLTVSPAPLIVSPAILVRHLICPQLGGPTVHVCFAGGHLLIELPGSAAGWDKQESTPAAVEMRLGLARAELFQKASPTPLLHWCLP